MKAKNLLLMAVMAGLSLTSVHAKTIYYVKVSGTGDGTSWGNAAGNIQDMIDKAVAGDEVWVAVGTYFPTTQTGTSENSKTFLIKDGVNLYGGFAGNETSINNRQLRPDVGEGKTEIWELTNETFLSGGIDNENDSWSQTDFFGEAWRWSVSGAGGDCQTVVTCSADVISETYIDGFFICCGNYRGIDTRGKTIIQNCIVGFNPGRGIYNEIGVIANCYIGINSGGGIYNSTGTVSNCMIDRNTVYDNLGVRCDGGGVINVSGDIIDCDIMNNQAITFQASAMNYGINPTGYGGGISTESGKIDKCRVMNNTLFSYNTATGGSMLSALALGGGIYAKTDGVISNCCIFNNKAKAVKKSTYYGATAGSQGGGVYGSGLYVYNSTVVNNSSDGYKDIYANNSVNCTSTTSDLNQNFIHPTTFVGIASNDQQKSEIMQADWHLLAGSEYIDAGSLDNLPDWVINGTDLAGNPRTHDGKISVGAYEYDALYTGIQKVSTVQGIAVFPSPAADFITVSGLHGNETLRFYNINGQLLLTRKASGEIESVTVGNLPSGIYLLKVDNGQIIKWIKR